MNESLLLLFDDLWKVKTKHIVLCLIALTNFWNAKGASYYPALMGNIQLLVTCISHINPVNELLFVCSACYAGQEMLWSRWRCLLGRKYLISIQVNVLKSVTIMTKRGDRTQADQIGTQDLDALDMLLKD